MEDIDIARKVKLKPINEVAKKMGINENYIENYGRYKAKISLDIMEKVKNKDDGKLVLVSSINPTPLGEGKTTLSIGLADGLRRINKKSILTLREPSLGPVFGIKGGATGGGYSQVAPMEDINLHFTGDIHAITSANNLLSAMIDNHIFNGNELKISKVTWKRCIDLNDRQLRKVGTGLSDEKNMVTRLDEFDISVASEIMAILCLSTDIFDLKRRLGNIIIGYNKNGRPITASDLKAEGAMTVLLKDAINPNLVQTLEQTPTIIHGGPFANIAHGCNSLIATKLALKLGDYCVTEAGFGADLGAEKFIDIKSRKLGKTPDAVVIVATIKALKYHGGVNKDDIKNENLDALIVGSNNLLKHVNNVKKVFGLNPIVAINKYEYDSKDEIKALRKILEERNIKMSLVECHQKGGKGAEDLAKKVVEICQDKNKFTYAYKLEESIKEKIDDVAKKIYGASSVKYDKEAERQIEQIEKLGYKKLPICIAKTQYSLSDDPKNLECNEPFDIHVKEVSLKAGAEFIVVITGKIMTMPGLPKEPAAEKIDIDKHGNIIGIF